jgi:23S rRNA (cytidine1920-2'-O)/16S rRNA (cytidine1409-2'-O)-methyltransferase
LNPSDIGRGGIIRNPEGHATAVKHVLSQAKALGLVASEVFESPILGGDGNKEFLCCFRTSD